MAQLQVLHEPATSVPQDVAAVANIPFTVDWAKVLNNKTTELWKAERPLKCLRIGGVDCGLARSDYGMFELHEVPAVEDFPLNLASRLQRTCNSPQPSVAQHHEHAQAVQRTEAPNQKCLSDSSDTEECAAHAVATHTAKLFGPLQPSAPAGHTSYVLERTTIPEWPKQIKDGAVRDVKYDRCGWRLFFRNPTFLGRPINKLDLERVLMPLRDRYGVHVSRPRNASAAIVQATFEQGVNLQLYTTKFAKSTGNAQINCSSKTRVREIREFLLRSQWFVDATDPGANAAVKVFQQGGAVLLPAFGPESNPQRVEIALQRACKQVGKEGANLINKYLNDCNVPQESSIRKSVAAAFEKCKRPASNGDNESGQAAGGRRRRQSHG